MVLYRRNFVPGGTYFFTATLDDRRSSLLVDHIRLLRRALRTTRSERPFALDAAVVLPEHLHVLVTLPPGDADYSGRWRRFKSLFSRFAAPALSMKRNHRGEFALWQKRFWEHTIRDEADFERHADYIHYSPVKHGLVSRVVDWPHSSFHHYVRLDILPADWGGDVGAPDLAFGERRD